jgi:hypothetical protein
MERPAVCSLGNKCMRYLALMTVLLVVPSAYGQATCSEEVKLLLSPTQVQAAVSALQASGETRSQIYFYDTPALDLVSEGVIIRWREGAEIDLTVKLRPVSGERFADQSGGSERYKCEVDLNDGIEVESFSMQKKYVGAKAPETGEEVLHSLSEGQKKLLESTKARIDWKRVKRVAEIRSTSWVVRTKAPLGKLSLERWEWPGGGVLEISTKVAEGAGQARYAELQELAKKKGLVVSANQQSKTAIVLGQNNLVR